MRPSFRHYASADQQTCLRLFDANCPEFFAPDERQDYLDFLRSVPTGYEVCEVGESVVAAFGLIRNSDGTDLNWIMLDPASQGLGIGSAIMQRVLGVANEAGISTIRIAASQKSAPFFARFGAVSTLRTEDGWGPGMDRIDMVLDT